MFTIILGVVNIIPPVLLLSIGPRNVFRMTARNVEHAYNTSRDELFKFGATHIVKLLEQRTVQLGQIYHVFNVERETWDKGVVVSVAESEFNVLLDKSEGNIVSISQKDKKISPNELISLAGNKLVCVDWEVLKDLPDDFFDSSPRDVKNFEQAQIILDIWKQKTRKLRNSERKVDFFISHAWKDNWPVKKEKLKIVADSFYKMNNGRYPTFWLDKLCFDQNNLDDSLRCLPLNIMMCHQLLALCGETYSTRLWCIWEIFTVLALCSDINEIKSKLRILPLDGNEDDANLAKLLEGFDVNKAKCFDPNEETKILTAIRSQGSVDDFNTRLRNFGCRTLS
jgi:hypothetical protein